MEYPKLFENFISPEDRDKLISMINAKEASGELTRSHTSNLNYDGRHMLWNTEDPEWWAIVKKYLQQIAAEHEEKIYPHDVAMLKYYPGPGMGLHSDQDGPCKGKCSYTSTIHLNIDYRGGSISFPRIDKVIKPPAGSAMFFPQVGEEWDHAISTLDSGERYVIITCWSKHEDMLRPQHSDFYTSS